MMRRATGGMRLSGMGRDEMRLSEMGKGGIRLSEMGRSVMSDITFPFLQSKYHPYPPSKV